MTLRLRLFLWNSGALLVVGGLLVLVVYVVVAHKTRQEFYGFLHDEFDEAARFTARTLGDMPALRRSVRTEVEGARNFPMVYRLYDLEKHENVALMATRWEDQLRALPPPPIPGSRPAPTSAAVRPHDRSRYDGFDPSQYIMVVGEGRGEEIRFLTGWVDKERHPELLLQVGLYYERIHLRLRALKGYLGLAFAASLALAAVGGYVLASRSLKPINQIATSLEQIDADNLSHRLPEPAVMDEIGRITRSANGLLGRLEEAFQRHSDFTADAAHELRTPLAAARCRLDVALERERGGAEYEQAIRDALEQLSGLNRLIENLLLLANLDARPERYQRGAVDLTGLLGGIVDLFGIAAEQKQVHLALDCPPDAGVKGNPTLLRRLFSNLLQNAIAHTPGGGEVSVQAVRSDSACTVTVADTGPGMAPKDLARVFERFHRADDSRSRDKGGFGLGLSICKKIVEVHDGVIKADSRPGEGATFTVSVPL